MTGRLRRQTRRRTSVELHRSFSRAGRAWVKDMWQASEQAVTQLAALSPLTTVLGRSLAERYAISQQVEGDEIPQAFFVVIMAGYASRTVLASATDQPTLDPSSLPIDAPVNLERIENDASVMGGLIDSAGAVALDDFESVMTLPPEIWSGYVALATMRLQSSLASSTVTWHDLDKDRIGRLLRYGYVLRCLDEALGEEPEPRED
jgi:hypothetical protein